VDTETIIVTFGEVFHRGERVGNEWMPRHGRECRDSDGGMIGWAATSHKQTPSYRNKEWTHPESPVPEVGVPNCFRKIGGAC